MIYSDCYTFGGSEYVVVNILKSKRLNDSFNFMFAYRYSKEYQNYVMKLFSEEERKFFFPQKLLSNDNLNNRINKSKSACNYKKTAILETINRFFRLLDRLGCVNWYNNFLLNRFLNQCGHVDLIHINNGGYPAARTCLSLAVCAGKKGFKQLFQVNNIALPSSVKNKLDCSVEKSVSMFLTATEFSRQRLAENRQFDINKIITLPNAVDFPLITKQRGTVLAEFGITDDSIVVTEVALLQERKGQIPLLNAFLLLKQRNSYLYEKIVVLLVGNGEDEAKIKSFIKDNELESNVKMTGYRMDYLDILNASDIYAQPSICDEDMPLSILSAMALGKPVVTTNIAGIPEEVENGINGFTIDPHNSLFIQMLSESLESAIINKETMGKKSYERYLGKFTRNEYERKLLDIYNAIIA